MPKLLPCTDVRTDRPTLIIEKLCYIECSMKRMVKHLIKLQKKINVNCTIVQKVKSNVDPEKVRDLRHDLTQRNITMDHDFSLQFSIMYTQCGHNIGNYLRQW